MDNRTVRESVRKHYGNIARKQTTCCGGELACGPDSNLLVVPHDVAHDIGYEKKEISTVPEGANLGLGCGNPIAMAKLCKGETVLDLGSGAGFDAFIASRKVGRKGSVIGVDMTDEMLAKAKLNAARGGFKNVEFRKGLIEKLPVEDDSVDVVISNCVINLSPDKESVFREAFRVLKPGGRLDVSDVLTLDELAEEVRNDLEMVSCCIGGAESVGLTIKMMEKAGFVDISIAPKDNSEEIISGWGVEDSVLRKLISAYIHGRKPSE